MVLAWFLAVFQSTLSPWSPSANAAPAWLANSTRVAFVDACTHEPIDLMNPNGTLLKVNFDRLNPNVSLQVKVTYRLAGLIEEQSSKNTVVFRYAYPAGAFAGTASYEYRLPRRRAMNALEQKNPGSHLWQVTVEWFQGEVAFGNGLASVLRNDFLQNYDKVTGPIECEWETSAAISSGYYWNPDQPTMSIVRSIQLLDQSGIGTDKTAGPDQQAPMQGQPKGSEVRPNAAPISLYFYKGRESEHDLSRWVGIERAWSLPRGQGGLFADRFSFYRVPAEHYEWMNARDGSGCGRYEKISSGELDVGYRTSEFYAVPRVLGGDGTAATNYIRMARPPLNTCGGIDVRTARQAEARLGSPDRQILFYTQKGEIQ